MGLKVIFINPNSEQDVDKYLPKILAQAIINKVDQVIPINERNDENALEVTYSA